MNLKALFLMDFIPDALQLIAVQGIYSRLCLPRLARAALWMLICTLAAAALSPCRAAVLLLSPGVYIAAVRLLLGRLRPRRLLEAALCMFCIASASAGFAALGGRLTPAAACGALALFFLLRERRNILCCWNIELYLELDGLCEHFPALIDTGNRLHEHGSGLPVVIAESAAIPRIARRLEAAPDKRFRTLPYGVLGGGGEIRCFLPDRLEFESRSVPRQSAPACWVALYPGRIPGRTRALAPPEFADAAQLVRSKPKLKPNTPRRLNYGIFKR